MRNSIVSRRFITNRTLSPKKIKKGSINDIPISVLNVPMTGSIKSLLNEGPIKTNVLIISFTDNHLDSISKIN